MARKTDIPKVVPNEKKLNAHPKTRRSLEAIKDPMKRFLEASRVAQECYRQSPEMITLRQRRRVAVVALFRFHGWNKAEIARYIGGEAQDRRVVDFAFNLVDLRDIPESFRDKENEALVTKEARDVHQAYRDRDAMGETAREMRRILVCELTAGVHGKKYSGITLAKETGVTTALVSQNITGSSNRKKALDRAAARAAKERGDTAA